MIPTYFKAGNELLNIYTKENPLLDVNDECYALIFNLRDYFVPIIVKATIRYVHIYRDQNRLYYIEIQSFESEQEIVNEYVRDEQFLIHLINKETGYVNIINQRRIRIDDTTDFGRIVFPTQAFFVRQSLVQIIDLYKFYLSVVKDDIEHQLTIVQNLSSKPH
jgi:hypothetical protein